MAKRDLSPAVLPQSFRAVVTAPCFDVDRHRAHDRSRTCRGCGVVIAICFVVIAICFGFYRNRDRKVRRHCGSLIAVCFDLDRDRHGDHGRACRCTKAACANRLLRTVMKAVTALRWFGMEKLR